MEAQAETASGENSKKRKTIEEVCSACIGSVA